jgi:hypothetical protein
MGGTVRRLEIDEDAARRALTWRKSARWARSSDQWRLPQITFRGAAAQLQRKEGGRLAALVDPADEFPVAGNRRT